MSASSSRYAIITAARNEAAYIEATIQSVVAQTLPPVSWIIVDDASSDATPDIVRRYEQLYPFISLVQRHRSGDRHFGNKATAFALGLEQLTSPNYEFLGNLDADISLPPDYYEKMLMAFDNDPKLGIGGGIVYTETGSHFVTRDKTLDSVGGAVQLFRRQCFEQVGGYLPLHRGGIDAGAEIMARMYGWTVRKFPDLAVYERRRTGSATDGILAAMYRQGLRFHSLGYGTVFYLLRCIYRVTDPPPVIGSMFAVAGFVFAKLKAEPVCLPPHVVAYLRREQRQKLWHRFFRKTRGNQGTYWSAAAADGQSPRLACGVDNE